MLRYPIRQCPGPKPKLIDLSELVLKPTRKTKLSGMTYPATFDDLAKREPKLLDLLDEVRSIHGVNFESCPENRWYGWADARKGMKHRLAKISGAGRANAIAQDYLYGQLKLCLHCIDRKPVEADLEWDLAERLKQASVQVQTQVSCRFGRADIVTEDTVYELKLYLTRPAIFQAVGQATLYAHAIGKPRIGIGGQLTAETHRLLPALKERGIAVELWDYPAVAWAEEYA